MICLHIPHLSSHPARWAACGGCLASGLQPRLVDTWVLYFYRGLALQCSALDVFLLVWLWQQQGYEGVWPLPGLFAHHPYSPLSELPHCTPVNAGFVQSLYSPLDAFHIGVVMCLLALGSQMLARYRRYCVLLVCQKAAVGCCWECTPRTTARLLDAAFHWVFCLFFYAALTQPANHLSAASSRSAACACCCIVPPLSGAQMPHAHRARGCRRMLSTAQCTNAVRLCRYTLS